jgi:Phage integrase family
MEEKIRYIQRVKVAGETYLYFRKGAYREGPLKAADGTPELREEVYGILGRLQAIARAGAPREGTIGAMLLRYAGDGERKKPCVDFLQLAPSTQKEYFRIATEIRLDYGAIALSTFSGSRLNDMRDDWAPRGHKATNDRIQVLKNALKPAIADERVPTDPFAKIEKMAPPHDREEPNLAWEDAEVEVAIRWCLGRNAPGLARAIALGRWAGFRRGTICEIPLGARTRPFGEDGRPQRRLVWLTEKRRVKCDKREDPRLTDLIERTANKTTTIAYNAVGAPWIPRQLNQAITRMLESLAKTGEARAELTIHGLRHARGVELALAGASDAEIMAQLEHATDRAAKIYRRQADRRRMADSGQDRIDNVVSLRLARGAPSVTNDRARPSVVSPMLPV